MSAGTAALDGWPGRTQSQDDLLIPGPARRLAATLDRDPQSLVEGAELPPPFHWVYFLTEAPASALGRDGHPVDGGFPPPVPGSRRMWAGGRLTFRRPLTLGLPAQRRSTIAKVTEKAGRAGPLVFVTVRHEIHQAGAVALEEDHDILYRLDDPEQGAATPRPHPPPPAVPEVMRQVVCDPVLLFRYSALTFNGHRIHYDRTYCQTVEGYSGLVVHGPLTATLLVGLAIETRPHWRMTGFRFRATAPLFDGQPIDLCCVGRGDGLALWAQDHAGVVAMTAEADFTPR